MCVIMHIYLFKRLGVSLIYYTSDIPEYFPLDTVCVVILHNSALTSILNFQHNSLNSTS